MYERFLPNHYVEIGHVLQDIFSTDEKVEFYIWPSEAGFSVCLGCEFFEFDFLMDDFDPRRVCHIQLSCDFEIEDLSKKDKIEEEFELMTCNFKKLRKDLDKINEEFQKL